MIVNNWFQINENAIQYGNPSISNEIKNDVKAFVFQNKNIERLSVVLPQGKEWIWRVYFKLVSKNKTTVKYGYDINLDLLNGYISKIDKTATNYAFVFDKNGTCVYHPEAAFIGKNIFKVSSFNPSDTIFSKKQDFAKRTTMSEFLKLDVIRFTKKMDIKTQTGLFALTFRKWLQTKMLL